MDEFIINRRKFTPEKIVQVARAAPIWPGIIGATTLANFLSWMAGLKINFLAGLTFAYFSSEVVTHAVQRSSRLVTLFQGMNIGIQLTLCLFYFFCWSQAKKGKTSWFFAGIVVYASDGFFALFLRAWIYLFFHIIILFFMAGQFQFLKLRSKAEAALKANAASAEDSIT